MAKTLEFTCTLRSPPHEVRDAIMRPALFLHVAAPLVKFSPIGMERFPEVWEEGEYRGKMALFGLIPIGWQAIVVSFSAPDKDGPVLRDRGYGSLLKEWDHRIEVEPSGGGSLYTDRLHFDAGVLTPIVALSVEQFFKHRQRRLRALDAKGFASLKG